MIKSMTAFSSAEEIQDNLTVSVEIRSYNSRYLDISLRMPQAYLSLEERIKRLVSENATRGRIEMRLQISEEPGEFRAFEINQPKAQAYHDALVRLKEMFGIEKEIVLENILNGTGGIIKPLEIQTDTEACRPFVEACVLRAMNGLGAMRKKEGDFMALDFVRRLDRIESWTEEIEKKSDDLLPLYQERLKDRIAALTGGVVETDPGRVAQEAAFLADRSDISEEIVRIESHIRQFRDIMDAMEPSGRKLNFLLQELNREFNTVGSKTGDAEISHIIVDVKSELEKIREQVQNVE